MAYYQKQTTTVKTKNKKRRSCFDAALHLLGYRAQSEQELTKKLKDREYSAEEIQEAMGKLKHYGYVNDAEYAADLFEAYRAKGTHGDTYIHQKLKLKGLHIEEHLSRQEEIQDCIVLVQKKAEISPNILSSYRRAAAFLARRGFSHSAIITALREFDFSSREEYEE